MRALHNFYRWRQLEKQDNPGYLLGYIACNGDMKIIKTSTCLTLKPIILVNRHPLFHEPQTLIDSC